MPFSLQVNWSHHPCTWCSATRKSNQVFPWHFYEIPLVQCTSFIAISRFFSSTSRGQWNAAVWSHFFTFNKAEVTLTHSMHLASKRVDGLITLMHLYWSLKVKLDERGAAPPLSSPDSVTAENVLTFHKPVCVQPAPVQCLLCRESCWLGDFPFSQPWRYQTFMKYSKQYQAAAVPTTCDFPWREPQVSTRCPSVKSEQCASCCAPRLCPGSHQPGTTESHRSNQRVEDGSAGISGGHHQQSGASLKLKLALCCSVFFRGSVWPYGPSVAFCPHSGRRTLGCWRARSSPSPWLSRPPWRWSSSVGKPCTETFSTGSSR